MNINAISPTTVMNSLLQTGNEATEGSESFSSILTDALQPVAQAETVDNVGNAELIAGDLNALHTTLIDAEKAEIALQLTLQIRNKVIDAYSEIMRMSV